MIFKVIFISVLVFCLVGCDASDTDVDCKLENYFDNKSKDEVYEFFSNVWEVYGSEELIMSNLRSIASGKPNITYSEEFWQDYSYLFFIYFIYENDKDSTQIIEYMLERGANPNNSKFVGMSATFEAVSQDRIDVIKLFEKYGYINDKCLINLLLKTADIADSHVAKEFLISLQK